MYIYIYLRLGWAGKHRQLPNNYLVKIEKTSEKNSEPRFLRFRLVKQIVNPDF